MENQSSYKNTIVLSCSAVFITAWQFIFNVVSWKSIVIMFLCCLIIGILEYVNNERAKKEEIAKKLKRTSTKKSKPAVK